MPDLENSALYKKQTYVARSVISKAFASGKVSARGIDRADLVYIANSLAGCDWGTKRINQIRRVINNINKKGQLG